MTPTTLELNGRVTVYTNQTPFEADILRSNTYKMVDVSKLAQTVLGTGINNTTLVSGLPCAPIAPPGLQVTVGPGSLYSYQFYEATPYGVLPADTDPNHQLYKQALNFNPVVLNTPAPVTIGNSIIYLVQAAFETVDTNVISRPYYNSADPTSPIFNSLSDTRQDIILINAKVGIEAPSPTPPTPDAGFVGLYYVTISFGQTSVVGGNITVANNAPFVTESLTQKISYDSVIDQKYTYFQDTGAVNALVVTPSTGYSSFPNGATISVRAANTVTGASNITIGSLGSIPIKVVNPSGLSDTTSGQIVSGGIYTFTSDGTVAQLSNPSSNVSTFYGASVYKLTNQNIPGTNTDTLITFDAVNFDTNSLWDQANYRFIVGKVGYFRFNANMFFSGFGGTVYLKLRKNGIIMPIGIRLSEINSGGNSTCSGTIIDYAASPTDYYQLDGLSDGSARPINASPELRFQIEYLGA